MGECLTPIFAPCQAACICHLLYEGPSLRLRNDLLCVSLDVKPYIHRLTHPECGSSDVVTLARPPTPSSLKPLIALFNVHRLISRTNFLHEPVSRLRAYLNPSFSAPLSSPFTPSLWTLNSKLTLSVNRFRHRSLPPDWLPRLMGLLSVSTLLIGFSLVLSSVQYGTGLVLVVFRAKTRWQVT